MHGPEVIVPLAGIFMIVALSLGIPFLRIIGKRVEASANPRAFPSDVTARLERIEHAIDAMAVEIERVAEGQRFTTKLLSERAADRDALPRTTSGGRS
jgi:hypothetical protein